MAKAAARSPSSERVASALAVMDLTTLRSVLVDFIEHVERSSHACFDIGSLLSDVPKRTGFLIVSRKASDCSILYASDPVFRPKSTFGASACCLGMGAFFLPAILMADNISRWLLIIPIVLLAAGIAFATSGIVQRRRAARCPVPPKFHELLLKVRSEILGHRRSWIAGRIAVKLISLGLIDHLAGALAEGVLGQLLSEVTQEALENGLEYYSSRDLERIRGTLLARIDGAT